MATKATGSFQVKMTPLLWSDPPTDASLARYQIDKEFHGDLEATSHGQMLSAGSPKSGSAGYVAIERVTGKLHGRSGSFALQHRGVMNHGESELTVTVVPGSTTGELEGLAGEMTIQIAGGQHSYEFAYTLATIQ